MKINPQHLRKNKKLTLYVPEIFIPYVEEAANLAEKEGKSLSTFLWEMLVQKLTERTSKVQKLQGSLAEYARKPISPKIVREQVKEVIAENAAKEGSFSGHECDPKISP